MQMFPTSRAGAVKTATPLMIVCFVAMGGFLYWLSTYRAAEVEADDAATAEDGGNEVAFEDFAAAPEDYMDAEFTMRMVVVNSMIGNRFFWTQVSDDLPYLVHITEEALADSVEVLAGRRVDVTGMVMALTDSVLDVWTESGAIRNEGDLAQVQYAEDMGNYLSVVRFETDDDGSGEPSGSSSGSDAPGPDDPEGSGEPSH